VPESSAARCRGSRGAQRAADLTPEQRITFRRHPAPRPSTEFGSIHHHHRLTSPRPGGGGGSLLLRMNGLGAFWPTATRCSTCLRGLLERVSKDYSTGDIVDDIIR